MLFLKSTKAFTLLEFLVVTSIASILCILCFQYFFFSSKLMRSTTESSFLPTLSFTEVLTKDLESLYCNNDSPIHLATDSAHNSKLSFHVFVKNVPKRVTYLVKANHLFRITKDSQLKIPIKSFNVQLYVKLPKGSPPNWTKIASLHHYPLFINFSFKSNHPNGSLRAINRTVIPMVNI